MTIRERVEAKVTEWKGEAKRVKELADKKHSKAERDSLMAQSVRYWMCASELEHELLAEPFSLSEPPQEQCTCIAITTDSCPIHPIEPELPQSNSANYDEKALGCVHGRLAGQPCPHCMGIGIQPRAASPKGTQGLRVSQAAAKLDDNPSAAAMKLAERILNFSFCAEGPYDERIRRAARWLDEFSHPSPPVETPKLEEK